MLLCGLGVTHGLAQILFSEGQGAGGCRCLGRGVGQLLESRFTGRPRDGWALLLRSLVSAAGGVACMGVCGGRWLGAWIRNRLLKYLGGAKSCEVAQIWPWAWPGD